LMENLKGRKHLEGLGLDGMILLKFSLLLFSLEIACKDLN
jgi:hypothetical protein